MSAEETTILEKPDIKVTNLRAVFGPKTYAISNITSVEAKKQEASGCLSGGLLIVGILMAVYSLTDLRNSLWMIITGAAFVGLSILILKSQKPTYIVQISSSSGEIKAYTSEDKTSIDKIVEALNTAIIQKG